MADSSEDYAAAHALEFKERGNAAFKAGDYQGAVSAHAYRSLRAPFTRQSTPLASPAFSRPRRRSMRTPLSAKMPAATAARSAG